MFKQAMINFAMIELVLTIASVNFASQIPITAGLPEAIAFVWLFVLIFSLLPSLAVAFLFAYFQSGALNGKK